MKAVVTGTGTIARQHLACLRTLPDVEISAVCDLSPALAEATAERFGIARFYSDHERMLDEVAPDIAHITTPPSSHFRLAMQSLDHGCHVIVEKPITLRHADLLVLKAKAQERRRLLVEDHNYRFNRSILEILRLIETGDFGDVVHVDVMIALNILGPGSPFADQNLPHPALRLPGGAIGDFLPHLAYLAGAFVGPHRSVRTLWRKRAPDSPLAHDEFRALVDGERATALLAFSAHAQPDVFAVHVHGTKMRALANLFETTLTLERLWPGPRPLVPLRNALAAAKAMRGAARSGLLRKLSGGPGALEGLWELLKRTYRAIAEGAQPPVSMSQIEETSQLVADMTKEEHRL